MGKLYSPQRHLPIDLSCSPLLNRISKGEGEGGGGGFDDDSTSRTAVLGTPSDGGPRNGNRWALLPAIEQMTNTHQTGEGGIAEPFSHHDWSAGRRSIVVVVTTARRFVGPGSSCHGAIAANPREGRCFDASLAQVLHPCFTLAVRTTRCAS